MAKVIDLSVPESLMESVDRLECKKKEAARKRREKLAQRSKEPKKKSRAARRRRTLTGVTFARKIIVWAETFCKTSTGMKILALKSRSGYPESGFIFFDDKVKGQVSCTIGVSENGVWWIFFGCGCRQELAKSPAHMAGEVGFEILKATWQSIESGAVWECIQQRLEKRG